MSNVHVDKLKTFKAIWHIDVETKFLNLAKPMIAPVANLINECFNKGVHPKCLKIVEVVPVFKKGDLKQAFNYRSISILPQFDKIMQELIYNRITIFLEKKICFIKINLELRNIHQLFLQLTL